MKRTPPPQFSQLGLPGQFTSYTVNEWHGPCPFCGGVDRFVLFTDHPFPKWRWFCRKCNPAGGWADELNPKIKVQDPAERARLALLSAKEAEERLAREIQRAQEALAELRAAQSWLRYHDQLTDWARRKWESWGVPRFYQDYWQLGYDPDRVILSDGLEHHTATMTIPVFEPITWEVINVRHRLLTPPKPHDKYRPDRAGLPASLYVAEPDLPVANRTVLVEGEKKAMVTFITQDDPNCQVVGIPGINPSDKIIAQLKDCDPLYICLDPDATQEAHSIALRLGADRCRILDLPDKIDDLATAGLLDKDRLRQLLKTARRVT